MNNRIVLIGSMALVSIGMILSMILMFVAAGIGTPSTYALWRSVSDLLIAVFLAVVPPYLATKPEVSEGHRSPVEQVDSHEGDL